MIITLNNNLLTGVQVLADVGMLSDSTCSVSLSLCFVMLSSGQTAAYIHSRQVTLHQALHKDINQ